MLLAQAVLVGQQLVAQVTATPSSSETPPPLKEIGHVHTSRLCSVLRHSLFPAVAGLRIDDDMIGKGQTMMQKTADDAALGATSAQITGGAGAGSEMDNFQLGVLSSGLARNLGKIEALLNDAGSFQTDPTDDDGRMLSAAKARLEAVAARQRVSLNVLSATAEINSANDLRAQRDIIPYEHDMSGAQTPAFTPITLPDALAAARKATGESELDVAPAMVPIAEACR
ncbi:MAG TPA: hypothetical protein VKR56_06020 [Candidatus Cybelea sp.]|nr:hypothetical protein [Candidatus Cybelea sp.]